MSGTALLETYRRHLSIVALVATAAYLVWRIATVDVTAPLQLVFLALELHAALSLALFVFSVWDTDSLPTAEPRHVSPLRVAVCITTYNEDEQVLLPTIASAVALEPAHETWVLDDGDRPWVKAMAEELGARYLTRSAHFHAKAGNINHAMGVIEADVLAVLDADHIPAWNFLVDTLGYFDDPTVALVQTPQDFYNLESFEHVGDYSQEALFYRVIQPGKNRWDAAFWCGTSALVRRDALRSIGGVATASVTEDLLTTIHLHGRGWRTVFHDDVLARGLAPASYKEFVVQRRRWATGAMQVLRSPQNPWRATGLTPAQRVAFTASLFGWFESLRIVGYLLLAVAVSLTGALPVDVSAVAFLLANGGLLLLTGAAQIGAGQGRHRLLPALMFDYLSIPMGLTAVHRLIDPGAHAFQVTPKGRSGDERERPRIPGILLALGGLAAAGVLLRILTIAGVLHGPTGTHVDVAAVVLVGQLAVLTVAGRRIRRSDFGDERRRARRFVRELRFTVGPHEGLLLHPSTTGAHIARQVRTGAHVLSVVTKEGPVDLRCWITPSPNGESTVEFAPGQYAARGALARTLYSEVIDTPTGVRRYAEMPDVAPSPTRRSDDPTAVPDPAPDRAVRPM